MASVQLTAGKEADLGSAEFALFWTEVRAPISPGLISHAVKTFLHKSFKKTLLHAHAKLFRGEIC